ncbi:MAG TPA: tetratricopeptide repeat protein [Gemmatimonadales bacterium]|jgi:tetratricopeptide (TPR) repeat protein|nr:tetratricopeptide repeat protein [Gemmatimonadales bacterium]
MKSYTTRDVARLLGVSPAQVRGQARAGFLVPDRGPRNTYRFSFQDLVLLRTAKALAQARVPGQRIHRALRRLVRQLPRGRTLSGVRITAEGDRVVVRDGQCAWNPDSGQLVLDLSVADLASRAAPIARRAVREAKKAPVPLAAAEWFALGIDLEAVAPAQAREAYERTLALEPRHADARVNLGRLLQESGEALEAVGQYLAALASDPKHPTAAFNLGTALDDLGRGRDAIAAYERAVKADPGFADAHYNLALLYEKAGRKRDAVRHMREYGKLLAVSR